MPLTFEPSADTALLYQRLRKASVGETLTYQALAAVVSKPIDTIANSLNRARQRAIRLDGIVFGVITGVGLRRLSDSEIVDKSASATGRIRRAARRGKTELEKANFDALPREKQFDFLTRSSVLGLIGNASSEQQIAKVRDEVGRSGAALPVEGIVAMFSEKQR